MRRPLLILATLAALLAAPPSVAAARGPAFGLRPVGRWPRGFFVYSAPAGRLLHGSIAVVNSGTAAGTVKLYSADATTGRTSGAVYLTSGEPRHGVGAWIGLARTRLRIGPRGTVKVPFTVRVPGGDLAGQHVGGIVAEAAARTSGPSSKGKTHVQINVRNLSIVAVEVNVPGPLRARLEIGAAPADSGSPRRCRSTSATRATCC